MKIEFEPVGFVKTEVEKVPRHWTVSNAEGQIVVDDKFVAGLKDVKPGQQIVVIFYFHRSPEFTPDFLIQTPPHLNRQMGVFSICSPVRPNPIGMSVLEVARIEGNVIHVRGIDMIDGTPVLDIKPLVEKDGKDGL
jgi:tRNA (adenine37-N6)-methyltransferase